MAAKFSTDTTNTRPIHVITVDGLPDWLKTAAPEAQLWVSSNGFEGKLGQILVVPDNSGAPDCVLAGFGDAASRARGWFHLGVLAERLPEGHYSFASGLTEDETVEAALAWLLAQYRFDRYAEQKPATAHLVAPDNCDAAKLEIIADGVALTSDLINTPASDMGPTALEAAFVDLATNFGATPSVIVGDDLLNQNFPMIHAVGRASDQAPRLLDMTWGSESAPKVTLVGKGVCFDTGGLNIKPGASMGLMKKDMGGAATVLGLAHMIMALKLPVRLRVLVPAVENSISAGAFRPQDILTSRKGLTVEVNNTDAEGRLVLADALALADEETPDIMVCMATLTGAARVALGPDLPALFSNDAALAGDLLTAGRRVHDPLWQLPLWPAYETMIEPGIADLDNAPKGGFGGAITAALFLKRFVENTSCFAHIDCYGWTPVAKPSRPQGGTSQGARAILDVIETRFGQ